MMDSSVPHDSVAAPNWPASICCFIFLAKLFLFIYLEKNKIELLDN